MAQTTLRFRIRPDGRVEELVEGVPGQQCESLTERIEHRLGAVQQRRFTSEVYLPQGERASVQQPLHQGHVA